MLNGNQLNYLLEFADPGAIDALEAGLVLWLDEVLRRAACPLALPLLAEVTLLKLRVARAKRSSREGGRPLG